MGSIRGDPALSVPRADCHFWFLSVLGWLPGQSPCGRRGGQGSCSLELLLLPGSQLTHCRACWTQGCSAVSWGRPGGDLALWDPSFGTLGGVRGCRGTGVWGNGLGDQRLKESRAAYLGEESVRSCGPGTRQKPNTAAVGRVRGLLRVPRSPVPPKVEPDAAPPRLLSESWEPARDTRPPSR